MHWLDRLSPRIQAQLERYARQLWFKSIVEARRRPGQDLEMLQGVSDGVALRAQLEERYLAYYSKHARPQMDGRTTQHVSTAALCLATYHALSPYALGRIQCRQSRRLSGHSLPISPSTPSSYSRSSLSRPFARYIPKERLLDIIGEQSGARGNATRFLVRATSFMQTYASLQQRLRLLQMDRGSEGFDGRLELDDHLSTLRFSRCLYADIFEEEEKLELLDCVCCKADAFWLTGQRKYKAGLRDGSKASGGKDCLFYVINRRR